MRVALLACTAIPLQSGPFAGAVRPVCADRDATVVASLARESAAFAADRRPGLRAGPQPLPRGILAELGSRPGRQVEGWLAFIPSPDRAGERVAGLVSLVTAGSATGIRYSIGWLLVHPTARRGGVGRALVAQACRRAADLSAGKIWVECRSDWAEAMAFWRSVGFDRVPSPDMLC
jgi:GNAT superfamily N-acetyltransferase